MKLFFFDIETTGLMHWKNGIHQISGMVEIDGETKEAFDFKVRPNEKALIEEDALKVAGVTKDEIMAYELMDSVFQKIEIILSTHVDKFNKKDKFFLVGYNNSSFDNQFLRAFFVQNAKTEKDAQFGNYFGSWFWSDSHDVMILASKHLQAVRSQMEDFKLKTVAKQLGIIIDESKLHDASYDIMLTREIYKIVS